jgi:hypothetical protein
MPRRPRGERLIITGGETGGSARLGVERPLQITLEIAPDALPKRLLGDQTAGAAETVEPSHPGRHMSDLVAIDASQNGSALQIADTLEPRRHVWCHVEPARLEHQWHDGKAGEQIIGGRRSRFPKPVMRRQIAIARP